MDFTIGMAEEAIFRMNVAMQQHREYLTELDSAIGDADHGTNMCQGFQVAADKIHNSQYRSASDIFNDMAITMIGSAGETAGPLYEVFL